MPKKKKPVGGDTLYEAILSLKDLDECKRFFQDLCTVNELQSFEQRFHVALMLSEGMIYSEIMEHTGASSATISRVNRSLQYGSGGYEKIIPLMQEKQKNDKL